MRLLYVTPPAKTSNELDTYRRVPDADVVALDTIRFQRDAQVGLASRALPFLGAPERWTAAVAWYRDLDRVVAPDTDVVLSAELYSLSSVQAGALARRLGARHVIVVAEILDRSPLNRLPPWALWRRRNAASVDAVVALTERAAAHVRHMGVPAARVHVVHPGVDTERFHPAPERAAEPVALFLGELRPDKGVLDAVAAGDRAAPVVGAGFRLLVAGDGPLRPQVEGLATDRPWLEVLGRVPRAEIPDLLRRCRAMISAPWSRPLWEEQFGYGLVEAMASGLPVVATTCGALPEVVPDGNPLVAEHDVAALADGLVAMLGPAGDAVGVANRSAATARYDLDGQAAALGRVLADVVARLR